MAKIKTTNEQITKADLFDLEQRLSEKIEVKIDEVKNYFYEKLDWLVKELKDMREENLILHGRHEQIADLDERVDRLEKIHPSGKHNFA